MRLSSTASEADALVGGLAPVRLERDRTGPTDLPEFLSATLLPGRGMNVFQVRALVPHLGEIDLLHSPSLDEARQQLEGGPDDFGGVHSFRFGGAILVPFANRIRGPLSESGCEIESNILGRSVPLPADWSGKAPGAEKCAIHGLILAARMQVVDGADDHASAELAAGDFGGHWLSSAKVRIEARLHATSFQLAVSVRNVGHDQLPVGIGWHPYFAIPSKRREEARVHLPARKRALVNNYDDVFPTGVLEDVAGTPYDFTAPEGAPLGSRYYDDSFVDIDRNEDGETQIEILDPAARYGIRLRALSPHVRAIQLYSRPDQPFVVVEPQFNWSDPFSSVWPPSTDTGMVIVQPGEETNWAVRWQLLTL